MGFLSSLTGSKTGKATMQAFAIALLKEAPMFAGSREEMLNSIAIITALVQAVGVALEQTTGKQLADYAFFENPPKITHQ